LIFHNILFPAESLDPPALQDNLFFIEPFCCSALHDSLFLAEKPIITPLRRGTSLPRSHRHTSSRGLTPRVCGAAPEANNAQNFRNLHAVKNSNGAQRPQHAQVSSTNSSSSYLPCQEKEINIAGQLKLLLILRSIIQLDDGHKYS